MPRFEPGHAAALRDVWQGLIWTARPVTVVTETSDQTILLIPAGVRWMAPYRNGVRLKIPQRPFELLELRSEGMHVLSFSWPKTFAAVLLLFGVDWVPKRWYVNLEDPLRRTPIGFDTLDRELDAVVEFDGSWRWKDEDELAEAIRLGITPAYTEERLRADGERAVRRILECEPPFDRDWRRWRPDPSWSIPVLPHGWDRV